MVATPKDDPNHAVGFGYGAFLPGYGGYVCYEPVARDLEMEYRPFRG